MIYDNSAATTILLAFTDVTQRRATELEKEQLLLRTEELLRQKDVLLREMEHRVANSLQIIASILLLKARSVSFGGDTTASERCPSACLVSRRGSTASSCDDRQ